MTTTVPAVSAPPAAQAPGEGAPSSPFRLAGRTLKVVVPAASVAALVSFFGYIYSQTFYDRLGLSVDALGLGPFDVAVRSSQVLVDVVLVLALALAGVALAHLAVTAVLTRARRRRTVRRVVVLVLLLGGAGLVGWPAVVTTGLLAAAVAHLAGSVALLYGVLLWWAGSRGGATGARVLAVLGPTERAVVGALLLLAAIGVVAYGAFTATRAAAVEVGQARAAWVADRCTSYPLVAVHSTVDLAVTGPGVRTTRLPGAAGDFRFRVDGLRLLNHRSGSVLVWPAARSPIHGVLALPADGRVRVEPAPGSPAPATCPGTPSG